MKFTLSLTLAFAFLFTPAYAGTETSDIATASAVLEADNHAIGLGAVQTFMADTGCVFIFDSDGAKGVFENSIRDMILAQINANDALSQSEDFQRLLSNEVDNSIEALMALGVLKYQKNPLPRRMTMMTEGCE